MAVGTIVTASLWQEFGTSENSDERYNELSKVYHILSLLIVMKFIAEESPNAGTGDDDDKEILDISVKGAIVFVITASTFLVLLYFFMSAWFVWLLIVLFCIGGVQVFLFPGNAYLHYDAYSECASRKCRNCPQKTLNLPLFGEVSIVSFVVALCCLIFAVVWAVNRRESYSWVGQDILFERGSV
ncbi:hypothetical protein Goshw_013394 [Gossypium schwendimanii]|uniref:Uncharacterized protein n=1 Tax=Gossypium schwendimanii TaxID=34291 RepID=A0A7J9L9N3_GOSSC|nr:hypothetical protein [Gossypium schwendimanii]